MAELSHRRFLMRIAALAATTQILRGRAGAQAWEGAPVGDRLATVGPGQLPAFAAKAAPRAQEAYRYAAANGDTLKYIFPSLRGLDGVRRFPEAEIDNFVTYLRSWQSAQ